MFDANLVIPAKIGMSYHADKLDFLKFWVKMAKIALNIKINDCHIP